MDYLGSFLKVASICSCCAPAMYPGYETDAGEPPICGTVCECHLPPTVQSREEERIERELAVWLAERGVA